MIRQFENEDLAAVMEIWLLGNLQAHHFIGEEYWRQNHSMVAKMILQAAVYVCEKNSSVVGFVGLEKNYIAGMFVRYDMQSCGIGKEMMDFLKSKYSNLKLNVYEKNSRALDFYLREGFEVTERVIGQDTGEQEFELRWRSV